MLYHSYYLSPIGWLEILADNQFLCGVNYLESVENSPNNENYITRKIVEELDNYFSFKNFDFSIALKPINNEFARDIYNTLKNTNVGEVLSYAELSKRSGHPNAARAVGNALHNNPFMIVVPCHRVINSDGKLGGFALDLAIKKQLLEYELAWLTKGGQ
ncbi:MAG: methylated-DNA--[protein]-cysteine S-methyltransferase [Bacilli bacterium]